MDRLTAFFQGELSRPARLLLLVASLAIVPAIALPTWTIRLHAPQYPNGLEMQIYPTTVKGDVREINLLNHYIGMHEIATPEDLMMRQSCWSISSAASGFRCVW